MGRMANGSHDMKSGCRVLWVYCMAMVTCARWFLDRKWVVNVYAIIINDGESYHGLRFALCLTVSGLPTERVYIKLT